jgi:hypothetical protein
MQANIEEVKPKRDKEIWTFENMGKNNTSNKMNFGDLFHT